jgi:hypothetical protein
MIKFENINKLVTKEDNYYVHKLLGLFCLVNFTYRYISLFFFGTMKLKYDYDIICISLHGLLSISSLIFHISQQRHKSLPIIYPEFRLHSIIFAMRSIFCTILHYIHVPLYSKMLVCLLTNISADIVTYKYKIYNNENNISTTMRNMPFDNKINEINQKEITRMHSSAQVVA